MEVSYHKRKKTWLWGGWYISLLRIGIGIILGLQSREIHIQSCRDIWQVSTTAKNSCQVQCVTLRILSTYPLGKLQRNCAWPDSWFTCPSLEKVGIISLSLPLWDRHWAYNCQTLLDHVVIQVLTGSRPISNVMQWCRRNTYSSFYHYLDHSLLICSCPLILQLPVC